MKLRGWLLLVLFAHVLLHPWVHAAGAEQVLPSDLAVSHATTDTAEWQLASDRCELCRVGQSTTALPQLPATERLNPRWIHTILHAVNYASLQADRRLPSRAPPTV